MAEESSADDTARYIELRSGQSATDIGDIDHEVGTLSIFGKSDVKEEADVKLMNKINERWDGRIQNLCLHDKFSEENEKKLGAQLLGNKHTGIKTLALHDTNIGLEILKEMKSLEGITISAYGEDNQPTPFTDAEFDELHEAVVGNKKLVNINLHHTDRQQFVRLTEQLRERDGNAKLTAGKQDGRERLYHFVDDHLTVTLDTSEEDTDSNRLLNKLPNELTVIVGGPAGVQLIMTPFFFRHNIKRVNVVCQHEERYAEIDTFFLIAEKLEVSEPPQFGTIKLQTFADHRNEDDIEQVSLKVNRMLSNWGKLTKVIIHFLTSKNPKSSKAEPGKPAITEDRPLSSIASRVCGDGEFKYDVDMSRNLITCWIPVPTVPAPAEN